MQINKAGKCILFQRAAHGLSCQSTLDGIFFPRYMLNLSWAGFGLNAVAGSRELLIASFVSFGLRKQCKRRKGV